jgi:hypothetical protein
MEQIPCAVKIRGREIPVEECVARFVAELERHREKQRVYERKRYKEQGYSEEELARRKAYHKQWAKEHPEKIQQYKRATYVRSKAKGSGERCEGDVKRRRCFTNFTGFVAGAPRRHYGGRSFERAVMNRFEDVVLFCGPVVHNFPLISFRCESFPSFNFASRVEF